MAWDNGNNNNPWGQKPSGGNSGGGGFGGGGSRRPGGGNTPDAPDIDEMLRKSQEQLRRMMGGGDGFNFKKTAPLLLAAGVALWLATGIYTVKSNEQGVELTFGKWSNVAAPSTEGLHYHWPAPIGQTVVMDVTRQRIITVGYVVAGRDQQTRQDVPDESLMVTGDENLIDIDFRVTWNIANAGDFLFRVDEPEAAVKRAAESAMREIVGRQSFDVNRRELNELSRAAAARTQELLNQLQSGIRIDGVSVEATNPPVPVVNADRDLQNATNEAQKARIEADGYRMSIIPRAEGQALAVRQEADAYREKVINQAKGDAERFTSVYQAYQANKDVTKTRMYLETMEKVLGGANKLVIDSGAKGLAPYLPLPIPGNSAQPAPRTAPAQQ
ncbi:MAG: FtsH protease activity modulator HflK [Alphaproteobacteria bacterium]|jgi:membrane protease subunit HflK|nr:FtsH protease activity modulator HflK [Alphaproteobacteria bacterium]